jgi:1A family penicillin-binding protein
MRRGMLVAAVVVLALGFWYSAYRVTRFSCAVAGELDRATSLAAFRPRAQTTIVLDKYGTPAFTFYAEQRIDVPLDRVSPHMTDAILTAEDRRFFSHYGVDPIRVAGAAWHNLRAGRIAQGGSTITQQLVRATQLSSVRTLERKIREAMIALRLEERYSKRQILQEYLNTVYFGEGYYGVEAASRGYFGKTASDLEPAEAALLAAMVRSPSSDAPGVSPGRAKQRRDLVLRLMRADGHLSEAQLDRALATSIPDRAHGIGAGALVAEATAGERGRYFQEEVRQQLTEIFGSEQVLRGGLRVYSTYDPELQQAAEDAIATRLAEITKLRPRARDLQGSLVAIDPLSGAVVALVGGRNYDESRFNRATQAKRQAGSAFKPIIYAAALEHGFAPGSLLRDLDVPIPAVDGPWLPSGEHEASEYTLRRALKVSSNRAAAQLLQHVGVSTTIYYAHRLGISSELPMVPSLALGTGEVTLLELTASYGAFANRGVLATPHLISRVENASGEVIWRSPGTHVQALRPTTAYLMNSMLADVVASGTATGVRAAGFRLPAAGKTGTTDDYADAWFIGYTPRLVAGVWFGLDKPAPIMDGGFGGVVAVPAWAYFMRAATRGSKPEWYSRPADVEVVAICRLSGARATEACWHGIPASYESGSPGRSLLQFLGTTGLTPVSDPRRSSEPPVYEDLFPVGTAPDEICPIHGAAGVRPFGG